MMGGVCLSVYLSVARLDLNQEWKGLQSLLCLDLRREEELWKWWDWWAVVCLSREWKGLRSPGWKHMTRVIREPIYRSNGKGQGHRVTECKRIAASCCYALCTKGGWNSNRQNWHRDSLSGYLAHQLILGKTVKGQGHRVKVKKSRRDSRVAPSRFAVTPLNATAPHRRREMCTLLRAQPLIL